MSSFGSSYPIGSTTLSTVGAGTLTGAQIASQYVRRQGAQSGTPFTDTTDTALNIAAAVPNAVPGQTFYMEYANQTNAVATIAAGSNVTLSGLSPTVGYGCVAKVLVTLSTIVYGPAAGAHDDRLNSVMTSATVAMEVVSITNATLGGGSTAFIAEEGNINRQLSSAGINPASTGADVVVAVYSLPANFFDGIGNRGLCLTAQGSIVNNANNKRVKIIFNATTAVLGSAVTGGTTIADTGTVTTLGGGFNLSANVFKTGAAGSNTQLCLHQGAQVAGTVSSLLAPSTAAAVENAPILIAVTANAGTTATDIVFNFLEVNAMN